MMWSSDSRTTATPQNSMSEDESTEEQAEEPAPEEEEIELRKVLPAEYDYFFTWKTIQESGHIMPPADIISTRTQSAIPLSWADRLKGIITRSTGYDHISAYLEEAVILRYGHMMEALKLKQYLFLKTVSIS